MEIDGPIRLYYVLFRLTLAWDGVRLLKLKVYTLYINFCNGFLNKV